MPQYPVKFWSNFDLMLLYACKQFVFCRDESSYQYSLLVRIIKKQQLQCWVLVSLCDLNNYSQNSLFMSTTLHSNRNSVLPVLSFGSSMLVSLAHSARLVTLMRIIASMLETEKMD